MNSRIVDFLNSIGQANETECAEALFDAVKNGNEELGRDAIAAFWASPQPSHKKTSFVIEILKRITKEPPVGAFPVAQEFVYRGCYAEPGHVRIHGLTVEANRTSTSIFRHTRETGSSIYVSTSTRFEVALDHALNGRGFVYKIKSQGGIDVASWGRPIDIFEQESEILYSRRIPPENIAQYCHARHDSTLDDFVGF